jgi:hypothetical protein
MHETELGGENYAYGRLSGINLKVEAGPAALLDKAFVYLSVHGCLPQGDQPIGLAAVPAEGRRFGALSQDQVLRLVRDRHRPERDLEGHILTTIRNVPGRKTLVAEMRAASLPDLSRNFEVLLPYTKG